MACDACGIGVWYQYIIYVVLVYVVLVCVVGNVVGICGRYMWLVYVWYSVGSMRGIAYVVCMAYYAVCMVYAVYAYVWRMVCGVCGGMCVCVIGMCG